VVGLTTKFSAVADRPRALRIIKYFVSQSTSLKVIPSDILQ